MSVTRRTKTHGAVDLSPVKGLFVSLVLVARPRYEVMTGQTLDRPAAQPASSALRAAASFVHSLNPSTDPDDIG